MSGQSQPITDNQYSRSTLYRIAARYRKSSRSEEIENEGGGRNAVHER